MAQEEQNNSSGQVRSFDKALNEDVNDFHLPSNEWTQARNAINNSVTGDLGKLGNEPANLKCIEIDYPIIGTIHVIEDKWLLYSTDKLGNCEIGLFREETCLYVPLVTDPCLGFSLDKLIIGVCRPTSTCTYIAYWDDGLNPSRRLEFDADFIDTVPIVNPNLPTDPNSTIPWVQTCNIVNGCNICTNTPVLDCDKLRLALFMDPICPRVERGVSGGNLLNGSYLVAMAYAINGQKISDWYVSNAQGLFDHNNSASSLDVFIDSIDSRYDEIIVATVAVINQQTAVRQAGLYSTRQTKLSFDTIFDTWPAIPIEQIPIMTPIVDKSDAMYNVGDYLIRVGPTSKFDFNYQPLANQIVTKWQSVEYPVDYYKKGGNKVGYMRDEVYSFFIQWIYDTGDKSASYHIPGRPAFPSDVTNIAPSAGNAIYGDDDKYWKVFNTAQFVGGTLNIPQPDGGVLIREGYMGYWESTENYPDNKPEIWNSSSHCWSSLNPTSIPLCPGPIPAIPYSSAINGNLDYDLCGNPIRHHKFPEDNLCNETKLFNSGSGTTIRVMGVKFENIRAPKDNDGNTITTIVGYEILRSTRNGNKSIIAKGIINNMGSYNIPGSNKQGLYPNYPYNDLQYDPFLSQSPTATDLVGGGINGDTTLLGGPNYKQNYLTFHSPDTNFNNPFLATKELKIYGNVWGGVDGKYDLVEKHPKEKLITNLTFTIAGIAGIGIAGIAANGKKTTTYSQPKSSGQSGVFAAPAGIQPDPTLGAVYNTAMISLITAALTTDATFSASGLDTLNAALLGVPSTARRQSQLLLFDLPAALAILNGTGNDYKVDQEEGYLAPLDVVTRTLAGIPLFLNYFTEGTDSIIRLIKAIIRYRDFAVRYHSHGFYNNFDGAPPDFRFNVEKQIYVNPEITEFEPNLQINNLYRNRTVALKTVVDPLYSFPLVPNPAKTDHTRYDSTQLNSSFWPGPNPTDKTIDILCSKYIKGSETVHASNGQICSSHYTGIKVRIRNQYSQLANIVQLPTDSCYESVAFNNLGQFVDINNPNIVLQSVSTKSLFGGDVYINRYTEKNTFFYFYDWLEGQPDGAQLNYLQHKMVPYPKYWANFNEFQTSDFTTSLISTITSFGTSGTVVMPSDFYALDGPSFSATLAGIGASFQFDKRGWVYLFNSGVRDFLVESEINVANRDYGELQAERFFDPYQGGDTKTLFDTAIIKSGNYYKYDISLSTTKLFTNYTSWGATQSPQYNPYIADTCFVYQPKKVIYSLPSQFEGLKDGWRIFLTNNYYNFLNVVTCIKSINKCFLITYSIFKFLF